MEWHDGILARLTEVLEMAAVVIAEGETSLDASMRVTH
jgi:hypothetical protein